MSNTNESDDKNIKERVLDKKFLKFKRRKILSSKKLLRKEKKINEQIQIESKNFIEFDKEERSEGRNTSLIKNENVKEIMDFELKNETDKRIKNVQNSENTQNPYSNKRIISSSRAILAKSLESLKTDDEQIKLSVLIELTSELSIANESLANDINCQSILKELVLILDQFNSAEILMYSMICINYILDLNPAFTSTIIKSGGLNKIIEMTQNIEFIDCAENAIKAIEKMSYENPYVLVEKKAFESILSLIDFFDMNLRKSAIIACVNMSKSSNNYDFYTKNIQPAIESLTNMTKYFGNSEVEKFILDKSILCFYNIITSIKIYNFQNKDKKVLLNLIQYGFLNNLFDVLTKFLKLLNDEKPVDNKSINIYLDTLKNILKVFEILCSQSSEMTNLILNMNILDIIYSILLKELGLDNSEQIKNKLGSSHHTILSEIFSLLNSFFPNTCSKEPDKIISQINKQFYLFFSEKILNILVKEIINIPSSNTVIQVIKLVEMYINYSQIEFISTFIDESKLSNICAKMLDSKDIVYIGHIFELVEIIMKKVPYKFIVPFLREGVVDYINNIITSEPELFYIPEEKNNFQSRYSILHSEEKDYIEINNDINKSFIEADPDRKREIKSTMLDMIKNKGNFSSIEIIENKEISKDERNLSLHNDNLFINKKNIIMENNEEDYELKSIPKDQKKTIHKKITEVIETNEKKEEIVATEKKKKISYQETLVFKVQNNAREIVNKYFKTEKQIDEYIKKGNSTMNPKEFIHKLNNISSIIKEFKTIDESILNQLCEILFNKDKLTFYEIEKSHIIYYLAKFFDENFIFQLEGRKERLDDIFVKKNLNFFFKAINYDMQRVKDLIYLLQNSISSMNCFKLYLYEFGNYKNTSYLFSSAFKHQPQSLKLKLNYKFIEKNNKELAKDLVFKDLSNYYSLKKQLVINIEQNESFNFLEEAIFEKSYKNVTFGSIVTMNNKSQPNMEGFDEDILTSLVGRKSSEDFENTEKFLQRFIERKTSLIEDPKNENNEDSGIIVNNNENSQTSFVNKQESLNLFTLEDLEVVFYIEINNEIIKINKNLTISDWLREIKKTVKKVDMMALQNDLQINFEINLKQNKNNHSCLELKVLDNDYLFDDYYNKHILNNTTLYSIKRASPFFYIISLLDLSLNKFPCLFNFENKIDEKTLENQKVSSLLTKQVRDPYAISSNLVPEWCRDICHNFTFLADFNARYLFFKTCSFEIKRSMTNLYIYVKSYMGENLIDDKTLSLAKRMKVKINRDYILSCAEKIMKEAASYNGYIEFEYIDETGTGQGPTLEFFNLFFKEIKEKSELWYKTSDYSLFPMPISHLSEENKKKVKKSFQLLGYFIARALYDDRLIDIPINSLFWDVLLERDITFQKIEKIDIPLSRVLNDLLKISQEKKKFIESRILSNDISEFNLEEEIRYNGKKLSEIDLQFTLPGINEIKLKENGDQIYLDIYNVEEYIKLIYEQIFRSGIKEAVESFRAGFNIVFPAKNLKSFLSFELEEIICSSIHEKWDYETLFENINPNHGYYKNSAQFKFLIQVLLEMSKSDKKKFLTFITGAPRLPMGGFKSLRPKLTIVKKSLESTLDNPDYYLPTVMTCQNYLKVPEYSSYEIFKSKLYIAMNDGLNAFHLS